MVHEVNTISLLWSQDEVLLKHISLEKEVRKTVSKTNTFDVSNVSMLLL